MRVRRAAAIVCVWLTAAAVAWPGAARADGPVVVSSCGASGAGTSGHAGKVAVCGSWDKSSPRQVVTDDGPPLLCYYAEPMPASDLEIVYRALLPFLGPLVMAGIMPPYDQIDQHAKEDPQTGFYYQAYCADVDDTDPAVQKYQNDYESQWLSTHLTYQWFPTGDTDGVVTPGSLSLLASKVLPLPNTKAAVVSSNGDGVVNAPTDMHVANDGPPVFATATVPGMSGTVTATRVGMWVEVGTDGDPTVTPACTQANPAPFTATGADCEIAWHRSTGHIGPPPAGYPVTVHVIWLYTYTGGPPQDTHEAVPAAMTVTVQEIQAVVAP